MIIVNITINYYCNSLLHCHDNIKNKILYIY